MAVVCVAQDLAWMTVTDDGRKCRYLEPGLKSKQRALELLKIRCGEGKAGVTVSATGRIGCHLALQTGEHCFHGKAVLSSWTKTCQACSLQCGTGQGQRDVALC